MDEAGGLPTGEKTREATLGESPQLEKQEPVRKWDAQFQEFLKTLQAPGSSGGGPQLPAEPRQGSDCRTPPAPSEGVTEGPGGLGAPEAQPMPTGEAKQDHEAASCGKEKKRVRTWDTVRAEMWRWRFRKFCYQEAEGPRETCRQLQELCSQWLRPKRHTKEEILDFLTLEQFLAVLPPEMQCWVRESDPENCAQAVTLAEDFLQAQQGAKGWQQQGSSEDMFVNLPKTSKELPGAAKKPCFTEAKQCIDGSANVSAGDGWLSGTEEELKPYLEIPEEEEPQEMMSETAKDSDSLCGRKGDENPCRAESQNGNNNEMEAVEPVFSEGTDQSLNEATAKQQVNSMKCETHKESFGPSPYLLTCERSQEGEKTYTCWHCGLSFGSISDLVSHERTHVGEKLYKCAHCGESVRLHKGQEPDKCSHCRSTIGWNSQEGIHTGEKPYICTVCGEKFKSDSGLHRHQRIHTGEKPYKCSQCGECFSWGMSLSWHKRIHTLCSYCGKSFSQNSDLVKHEQTHTVKDAFACFACGKAFDVSAELVAHVQTHREKPFESLASGKTFQKSLQLVAHQKVHVGDKQHSEHQKVHVRKIHIGQKPYKCSDCGKIFSSNYSLLLHQKIHTGEETCTCSKCGRTFWQRSDQIGRAGEKGSKCSECLRSRDLSSSLVVRARNCAEEKPLEHERIPTAKEAFAKEGQGRDAGALAGDGWLSETEEELKPFLDSPEEEEPQEMTLQTAKENDSPPGRNGDENPCRAESQNGNINEMEAAEPVLSEDPDQSLSEATALQQVNSMKCEAQEESFGPSPHLLSCKRSQAGEKTYTCWHCGQNFGSSRDLLSHERSHVGDKLYKCAHCGEHEKTPTGQKPHKCSNCGNTFGLNSQEGIQSRELPYKCDVCVEKFTSDSGLKQHLRIHAGEKPFRCSHCGECFRWSSDLKYHERTHTTLFSYCEESFSQNSDLVEHEQTHTSEEPFTCFACGKAFDVSAELAAHIQTHKETPFDCSLCGKTFRNSLQLVAHQKVHMREKQHKSSRCGKSFSQKQSLIIHKRTHTGGKPYKCLVCGKTFRNLPNPELHERTHTGGNSYKCSYCDKSFQWSSHLVLHERTHTEGKPTDAVGEPLLVGQSFLCM